jgi:hypothetical protein
MIFSPRSDEQGCKVGAFALISKLDASEAFIEANRLRRILLSRKMNRASKIIVPSDGAARQNFTINFLSHARNVLSRAQMKSWDGEALETVNYCAFLQRGLIGAC